MMQHFDAWRVLRTPLRRFGLHNLSADDRNILYLTIDTALQGIMMGGVFSFISVFLVRLGATKLQTSLLTSLPAIVMVLSSIPAGVFVQRRRNLVRVTNAVRVFHRGFILLTALLPFVVRQHLVEIIIAVWTVKAVTNALLESSWIGVVAEAIPPHRRAAVNGTRWTLLSIVMAIAGAGFGTLLETMPFPLNYQIVFLISFLGGAAGMIFWSRIRIPENARAAPPPAQRASLKARVRTYWRNLQVPAFLRYVLTMNVLRLALNLPIALYSIYWIRALDASDLVIGWRNTANQVALIAGYALWGKVVSRKGHFVPLLICSIGAGIAPVLTAFIPGPLWLPVIAVVEGLFLTGINLATFDTLLAVCPSDRRPSFVAVNTMLASLMIFLGPMIGSALADLLSVRGVFFIAAGVHVVAMVLFWRYRVGTDEPAT
jgi:MFS family permease